jgi:glycosyltransferase involved in cell wall biosynthesis
LLTEKIRDAIRQTTPASLRPVLRDISVRLLVPSAGLPPQQQGVHVTVVGPLRSSTGIGAGARLAADALAELGFSVGRLDVTGLLRLPADMPLPKGRGDFIEGDAGGPLIVHLNPPHFQMALLLLRLSGWNRPLIAFWAWEMERVPTVWRRAFRLAHEIWVPSQFVAAALKDSGCRKPIRVVPHPVRVPLRRGVAVCPATSRTLRVLTVFAYDSHVDRKNPFAALAAFRRAFGDRPDVELVIKTRGRPSNDAGAALEAAVADMDNVRIIDQVLDEDAHLRLIDSADVVLSMHRAEGFGLPLAEAMAWGKPVVATAWSGNLDFMTGDTACLVPATLADARADGSVYQGIRGAWAEPSVEVASDWLRRLLDPALRCKIGDAAREHVGKLLGLDAFRAAITESNYVHLQRAAVADPPQPACHLSGCADRPATSPAARERWNSGFRRKFAHSDGDGC